MSTLSTCTATTRPVTPFLQDGDILFETDTNRIITWDASATSWRVYNSTGSFNPNINIPNTSAMHFDGTDDGLSVTGNSRLDIQGDVTIAGWFNLDAYSAWSTILSWGASATRQARSLGFNSSNQLCFNSYAAHYLSTYAGQTTLSINTWYHGACTVTASGDVYVYLDGVLDNNNHAGGSINAYTYTTTEIGLSYPGGSGRVSGTVDEVSVWDTCLSAAEIAEISSSRSGYDLTSNNGAYASSSNLKGWWRMGDGTGDSSTLIKDMSTADPALQNDMVPSGASGANNTPQLTSVTMPF